MEKKYKDAIGIFAKDISCLDAINKELSTFNFFEILKIDQFEIKHSNMLAWLLNPKSESGIGDKLLKRLVYYCADNAFGQSDLSPTEIEVMDFRDVEVLREKMTDKGKQIDLLIESRTSQLVICIENKINSSERKATDKSHGQLEDYKKYVEQEYDPAEFKYIFFVFLTPEGIEASADNAFQWIAMSYNKIYEWLLSITQTYESSINEKALFIIKEYLNNLSRNVISDTRLKDICDVIYMKHIDAFKMFEQFRTSKKTVNEKDVEYLLYSRHKQAIDYILLHKTSVTDLIKNVIKEGLSQKGYTVEYSTKRVPIFIKVPYANIDESIIGKGSSCDSDYMYYRIYLFQNSGEVYLQLCTNRQNLPDEKLWNDLEKSFTTIGKKGWERKVNANNMLFSNKLTEKGAMRLDQYEDMLKAEMKKPSINDVFIQTIINKVDDQINTNNRKFWNSLQKSK